MKLLILLSVATLFASQLVASLRPFEGTLALKTSFNKLIIFVLFLISSCTPAAVEPTPTLYIIPTWPPTMLPTIGGVPSIINTPTLTSTEPAPPTVTVTVTELLAATDTPPTITSSPTSTIAPLTLSTATCALAAEFVADVTIPDNSLMALGQQFTKIWRLKNSGTCDWDSGHRLVYWMGHQMSAPASTNLPATKAGQTVDVSLNMIAPTEPGVHLSVWKIVSPDGTAFGTQPYVRIVVVTGTITPTTPTAPSTPLATATKAASPIVTPSSMPTNPVISGITARSRTIYLTGKQRGNNRFAFSKAGDSLTATHLFLYQIGDFSEVLGMYSSLAPAINYFRTPLSDGSNAFNRTSKAANGGWDSVMLLDPARADTGCNGLSPFECELVLFKPSVILILIGTNDAQHHLDSGLYEQNLRTMVQLSINNGAIPVLYTIPWNKYRDPVPFNNVITSVARSYDIPLVNYYAVMEQLPNHGLGEDGVHPSEPPDYNAVNFANNLGYGTTVRNLVTVQLLDALWRQIMYD